MTKTVLLFSTISLLLLIAVASLLVAVVVVEAKVPVPPVYTCKGTYFDCAKQIGMASKDRIHKRLKQKDVLHAEALIAKKQGHEIFERFQMRVAALYPNLVLEMQGMAFGAGVTYNDIFLLNSLDELGALEGGEKYRTPSCTDVLTNQENFAALSHNEDNVEWISNLTYMVDATIYHTDDGVGKIAERFIAYAYPGVMQGNYFSFTHHGLVFSDNYIFAKNINFDTGVPSNLKNRNAMKAESMEELLLNQFVPNHAGGGYNLNVASTRPQREQLSGRAENDARLQYSMHSFESAPTKIVGVNIVASANTSLPHFAAANTSLPRTFRCQTNDYETDIAAEIVDLSSIARLKRLSEIVKTDFGGAPPSSVDDVRKMLGDTQGDYPVYRFNHTSKVDHEIITLSTMIFDLTEKKAYQWFENPKENAPQKVWNLW